MGQYRSQCLEKLCYSGEGLEIAAQVLEKYVDVQALSLTLKWSLLTPLCNSYNMMTYYNRPH